MNLRSIHLLAGLLALVAATVLVLTQEASYQHQRTERSEACQHLVSGLGFGPSLDLTRCEFRFDPRLADHDTDNEGPLPGGARYFGAQGSSIFQYKPLNRKEQGRLARD
jgi:hypothetical protein